MEELPFDSYRCLIGKDFRYAFSSLLSKKRTRESDVGSISKRWVQCHCLLYWLIITNWQYFHFVFSSTPITARKPASRIVRQSSSNVTGVQKTSIAKPAKKGLTVRVERESVDRTDVSVEAKRAGGSKSVAEVSIVDRLVSWEKKNDQERSVIESQVGK